MLVNEQYIILLCTSKVRLILKNRMNDRNNEGKFKKY